MDKLKLNYNYFNYNKIISITIFFFVKNTTFYLIDKNRFQVNKIHNN